MKANIRAGTFETNSSSSHSVVLFNTGYAWESIPDDTVYYEAGRDTQYGWDSGILDNFMGKFAYLMASAGVDSEIFAKTVDRLKEMEPNFDFQVVSDDKVLNEEEMLDCCGIDHGSYGVLSSAIWDLRKGRSEVEAVIEYLLNTNIVVLLGNDNELGFDEILNLLPDGSSRQLGGGY